MRSFGGGETQIEIILIYKTLCVLTSQYRNFDLTISMVNGHGLYQEVSHSYWSKDLIRNESHFLISWVAAAAAALGTAADEAANNRFYIQKATNTKKVRPGKNVCFPTQALIYLCTSHLIKFKCVDVPSKVKIDAREQSQPEICPFALNVKAPGATYMLAFIME